MARNVVDKKEEKKNNQIKDLKITLEVFRHRNPQLLLRFLQFIQSYERIQL